MVPILLVRSAPFICLFRFSAANRLPARLVVFSAFLALFGALLGQVPSIWQSRGVGGGGALYSPSINPANDSEYYVASDMSELFRTTDFGNSYSVVNFAQVQGGHYSAVRFTNNPLIAYTVTYTGGNYALPAKTTDGGTTWSVLSGNPLPNDEVYSVWADPNNSNRVIVAGWSDLYYSTNGGTSFAPMSFTANTANGVLICGVFFDGNNIYLGTNVGLLVSTNGGTSFTNAGTPGIPATELMLSFAGAKVGGTMRFFCLTAANSYPGLDLGSDYYGNLRGIYSLENGTGSWTAKLTGINPADDFLLHVAMATNDINTVYAAGSNSSGVPTVFKTTNAGASWTNTFQTANNANINTGWSGTGGDRGWGYGEVVFGLAVAPNNSSKAIITDFGFVHRTSNGGTTWQQAYVDVADQHAVNTTAISADTYHSAGIEDTTAWQLVWSDAQHLVAAFSDIKGIRSSDGGTMWTLGQTGHNANTMYRIEKHPTTGVLYAGTSDIHDLYQSTRLADNPLNNNDANGKVIMSSDHGATWQAVHTFSHPVFWVATDPTNPNRMYASVVHSTAGGIFVTNNLQNGAASTWAKLSNPPRTEGHPAAIVVLDDGKVVCTYSGHRTTAFTASSGVFIYDPAATTWSDVSDPGMRYWTKDIVLDPSDATQNTWYVGVFSGWGGPPNGLGGLYRTTNRGTSWTKINSLDRVTSITFHPTNPDQAYLTTETDGLWHSNNARAASPTFTLVSSYPFRQPERVFFNPYNVNEVWVTSFGNGLRVGTLAVANVAPSFTTQPVSQTVTAGSAVTFTVAASGSPAPTLQWKKDNVAISGATNTSYSILSTTTGDAGSYTVVATNSVSSVTSNPAVLTINTIPVITSHPVGASVATGASVTFTAAASGSPTPAFQWRKSGVAIAGATSSSFVVALVTMADAGTYAVVATNAAGSVTSNAATLNVRPAEFDVASYYSRYPAAAAVYGADHYAAWLHYRNQGIYDGEVFDDQLRIEEYLALYPELVAIYGTDLGAVLEHWLTTGKFEGRLGRVPTGFSATGYFSRNPDVAIAVNNDPVLAWEHFWLYGIYEGRAFDDEFRAFEYLAINADLTAAFVNDWRQAALHWLRYGQTEGRLGRIPLIFGSTEYLTRNPDVAATWGTNPTTVFLHFWLYGVDEGRTFDNFFRADEYLALNPDLLAVFGTDRRGAFMHWVRYGRTEGRPGRNP